MHKDLANKIMTSPFPDLIHNLPEVEIAISGARGWLLQSGCYQVGFYEVAPGLTMPPHDADPIYGIIVSGESVMEINGKTYSFRQGDTFAVGIEDTWSAKVDCVTHSIIVAPSGRFRPVGQPQDCKGSHSSIKIAASQSVFPEFIRTLPEIHKVFDRTLGGWMLRGEHADVAFFDFDEGWTVPEHADHLFAVILEGAGEYMADGQVYSIKKGDWVNVSAHATSMVITERTKMIVVTPPGRFQLKSDVYQPQEDTSKTAETPYPEFIRNHPRLDKVFNGYVDGHILQGGTGQLIFLNLEEGWCMPEHDNDPHWGIIIKGVAEMVINGKKFIYKKGDSFNIRAEDMMSATALTQVLTLVFTPPGRFRARE